MNKEVINKLQQSLLAIYSEFKDLESDENTARLKEIAENGIASAIGAMELMKLNNSKE